MMGVRYAHPSIIACPRPRFVTTSGQFGCAARYSSSPVKLKPALTTFSGSWLNMELMDW